MFETFLRIQIIQEMNETNGFIGTNMEHSEISESWFCHYRIRYLLLKNVLSKKLQNEDKFYLSWKIKYETIKLRPVFTPLAEICIETSLKLRSSKMVSCFFDQFFLQFWKNMNSLYMIFEILQEVKIIY